MKKIYAVAALLSLAATVQAQEQAQDTTLNRTVVVEQEYTPHIVNASKINVLPQVEPPTASKHQVEYDASLRPSTAIPATAMPAYVGKEIQQKALPGYIRLGYGNLGNLDVYASYLFNFTKRDKLNVNFSLDGMDGELEPKDVPHVTTWDAYYYRTRAKLDYTHAFKKAELNIAAAFGLHNFNLLPRFMSDSEFYSPPHVSNSQKFLSGDIHVGVKSLDAEAPVQYNIETNYLYYTRRNDIYYQDAEENIIRTNAHLSVRLGGGQRVGAALNMDNVFYKNLTIEDYEFNELWDYENYTSLELNPYYSFENERWDIRLGAYVNPVFGFGKSWQAAPDVKLQYNVADGYLLYAKATGGRRANDFRALERQYPHTQLYKNLGKTYQLDATYETVNAALGFKGSPIEGFHFHLFGGYQLLENDIFPYSDIYLQQQYNTYYKFNVITLEHRKTKNLYGGAEVSYAYKDWFKLSVAAVARSWRVKATEQDLIEEDSTTPSIGVGRPASTFVDFALAFKPIMEVDANLELHPVSPLYVNVGYQHVKYKQTGLNYQIPTIGNLYLGATYDLYKGIGIYVRAENLLDKDYQSCWACPAKGRNFWGGITYRF